MSKLPVALIVVIVLVTLLPVVPVSADEGYNDMSWNGDWGRLPIKPTIGARPNGPNGFVEHWPVIINSDADFTVANGVTGGSGTAGDPYIIEGWEFNSSGYDAGIRIWHTRAHLILRNCLFDNKYFLKAGIYLMDVQNAVIENNTIYSIMGNYGCIYLTAGCTGIIVQNNNITENSLPSVELTNNCEKNIIRNNTMLNNTSGLSLIGHSGNNTITGNLIAYCKVGFIIYIKTCFNSIHHNYIFYSNLNGNGYAVENDSRNYWNDTTGGNYWSEWITPDNDSNGIVDIPYSLNSTSGSRDMKPLAKSPYDYPPPAVTETLLPIAVALMVATFFASVILNVKSGIRKTVPTNIKRAGAIRFRWRR